MCTVLLQLYNKYTLYDKNKFKYLKTQTDSIIKSTKGLLSNYIWNMECSSYLQFLFRLIEVPLYLLIWHQ